MKQGEEEIGVKYKCVDCARFAGNMFGLCKPGPECDGGAGDDQAKPSGWEKT